MGHIHGMGYLKKYGIGFLTGESDAYSIRGLFDVNEKGKKLLESFFGGTISIKNGSNWNSSVEEKGDAIGSIMLPYDIFKDLATFCLFQHDGYYAAIYHNDGSVLGTFKEELDKYKEFIPEIKFKINWAYDADRNKVRGGRNVHQMSGRAE